jgi:ABC-type multidrug transport system ATPase subunit
VAPNVIEVSRLQKDYRRLRGTTVRAVNGLDLEVPEGGVFGFLGPNGAGKTTTIRCLLGLVRPSSGELRMFGRDVRHALPSVIGDVGSIVEAPAFFSRFSGRRNLAILARLEGIGADAIEAALGRVGLADRAGDLVRTYSLGMKQRLGIAAALLKDPSLLILDEPANGLDPAGIVEVRELIRTLGAEGRTVFVSSHLLSEVQQMADRVAILANGKLVATGSVSEVLSSGAPEGLLVRARDLEAARAVLTVEGFDVQTDGGSLTVRASLDAAEQISRALGSRDIWVTELCPIRADLETVFLELTRPGDEESPS